MTTEKSNSTLSEEQRQLVFRDLVPFNPTAWENTEDFMKAVVQVLLNHIRDMMSVERHSKVLDFHPPEELKTLLDLKIPDDARSLEELLEDCQTTLKYVMKTGHPRFFNLLPCGLDLASLAGEWLSAVTNANMHTYEIAPVFLLMEQEVMEKMWQLIGWEGEADGIFAPGGSISTLYALLVARYAKYPECKSAGMGALPKLCVFTSRSSHYSIRSGAAVLGIGTDNCFNVDIDSFGRMVPEALEAKIIEAKRNGLQPFFVACTHGTTVYGAFDPCNEIAAICKRHNLWLHVDAAWGGGLLLSKTHRHKLSGIEKADSVTWNPHKLMGALLQCSVCLVKKPGLLLDCNRMCADYLFQPDKPYDVSYDTGDKAIQCGRHNDISKLWLMWRSKGMRGFEQQVDRLMALAAYLTARLKATPGYEMVLDPNRSTNYSFGQFRIQMFQPEFLNICFWYVPPKLRHLDEGEKKERLHAVTPKIRAHLVARGTAMLSVQPEAGQPNFFRMIMSNNGTNEKDLDFLITEIAQIGDEL